MNGYQSLNKDAFRQLKVTTLYQGFQMKMRIVHRQKNMLHHVIRDCLWLNSSHIFITDADLCASNSCGSFGTCIDLFQSYVCSCDDQHVGGHCQYWKGSCDFEAAESSTCYYDNTGNGNGKLLYHHHHIFFTSR